MTEQEMIRAARADYARKWRAKNPDKVKRAQERYWRRRAEKMLEEGAIDANRK